LVAERMVGQTSSGKQSVDLPYKIEIFYSIIGQNR